MFPDSSVRDDYVESLEMVRALDFDVIAPWATALDGSYFAFTDEDDTGRRIDKILETMRRD